MIMNEEPSSGISPASRLSPSNQYRSSPEPTSNPTFPPPPNTRQRAGSSDRTPHLFNISSFSRRPAQPAQQEAPRLSPEINRDHASGSRRPVPISIEAPSSEEEGSIIAESRPPASRRAASTGAISTPSSSRSRTLLHNDFFGV